MDTNNINPKLPKWLQRNIEAASAENPEERDFELLASLQARQDVILKRIKERREGIQPK